MNFLSTLMSLLILYGTVNIPKEKKESRPIRKRIEYRYQSAGGIFVNPLLAWLASQNIHYPPANVVRSISSDRSGNLWFGSWQGIFRLDASYLQNPCLTESCTHNLDNISERATHLLKQNQSFTDFSKKENLPDDHIVCALEDRAGNLWFVVRGDNLQESGVYRFDRSSLNSKPTYAWLNEDKGLPHNQVFCLMEDHEGNIWMGTAHGVYIIKAGQKELKSTGFIKYSSKDGLVNDTVYSIAQDKEGTLWFGTAKGVCTLKGATAGNKNFELKNNTTSTFRNVRSILIDQKGYVWIGGDHGLTRIDRKSGISTSFSGLISEKSKTSQSVWTMYQDKAGNLWMGLCEPNGIGGGLLKMEAKGLHSSQPAITRFTEKDGLSNNRIYSIFQDKTGSIWLGTGSGLYRYRLESKTMKMKFAEVNGQVEGC